MWRWFELTWMVLPEVNEGL